MFATSSGRRRGIVYVLLVAASLLLIALSGSGALVDLRAGIGYALTPIQEALTGITRGATSLVTTVGEMIQLRRTTAPWNRRTWRWKRRIGGCRAW
jgi:hypothetical protein